MISAAFGPGLRVLNLPGPSLPEHSVIAQAQLLPANMTAPFCPLVDTIKFVFGETHILILKSVTWHLAPC